MNQKHTFSLLLFLSFFVLETSAQSEVVLSESKTLAGYQYKELSPPGTSDASNLPIVIGLHWMGSSPEGFADFFKGFPDPVRVLLVQAPYPLRDGYTFFKIEPVNYYHLSSDQRAGTIVGEVKKLSRFIEAAMQKYKHPKKPVVIGASQGGDLSYMMALRHGELIGLSCPLLATIEKQLIKPNNHEHSYRIVAFHGTEDQVVNIKKARKFIKKFSQKGFQASLKEYEGYGHEIPDEMKNDYIQLISDYFSTTQ